MSYICNNLGAYYEYQEHQVFPYAGLGAAGSIRQTFNADKVWADAQLGGTIGQKQADYQAMGCQQGGGSDVPSRTAMCQAAWNTMGQINAAGGRAALAIQQGLNELGYGPIAEDGYWGSQSGAAWERFCTDQNLPAGPGLVNKAGIYKMGDLLKSGAAPGPAKAGMPTWGWLLLIAAGVGGVALLAKGRKSKPAQPPATSPTASPFPKT